MTEWAHFIGEKRYTTESFIAEAERYGISRNIPAQQLKGIQFGDVINLMLWDGDQAVLFAQFIVSQVLIRDTEISAEVGDKLVNEGRAEPGGGGGEPVHRACGSYVSGGGVILDQEKATVREIVDLAEQLAAEKGDRKIKFMVGGKVSHQFPEPVPLGNHGPRFSRGFIKYSTGLREQPLRGEKIEMKGVADYRPARKGQSLSEEDLW
jgi:hypothetical protein